MNNKRRVISEQTHDAVLRVIHSDKSMSIQKHRVIERKIGLKPEMIVDRGRIWYDYTSIFHYAWETGQEARVTNE